MNWLTGALTGTAAGIGGSALSSLIQTIFVKPRNIAGFVADVTIEERHEDVLTITSHPVERGSNVSDHAYKQPAKVTIKCGWSNSSLHIADIVSSGDFLSLIDPNYVRTVYERFLTLQSSREVFDVIAGKRSYQNMLISRLMAVTDESSENSLMLTVECQEIIFANTQTVQVGTGSDTSKMASPGDNSGIANAGTKQVQPASVSGAGFASW